MSDYKALNAIAYGHLRRMIYASELEFNKVYSETKLAAQLSISRTPIRDALKAFDDAIGQLEEFDIYGDVLRAKGILPLTDGRWLHFDYVPDEVDIRYGSADYTGRLCVIGCNLKEDALKALFGV